MGLRTGFDLKISDPKSQISDLRSQIAHLVVARPDDLAARVHRRHGLLAPDLDEGDALRCAVVLVSCVYSVLIEVRGN